MWAIVDQFLGGQTEDTSLFYFCIIKSCFHSYFYQEKKFSEISCIVIGVFEYYVIYVTFLFHSYDVTEKLVIDQICKLLKYSLLLLYSK